MNLTLRNILQILVLLGSFSMSTLVVGQSTKSTDDIRKIHFSNAEKTVIPGGKPDHLTEVVFFHSAADWFKNNDLVLADFESVRAVEIRGTLSKPLSKFIAKFPNLKHISVVELAENIDVESVVRPLSNSKTLQSLDICMVDVTYLDFKFLAAFEQISNLSCDVIFSEKELVAIQKLKNLRSLEIGFVSGASRMVQVDLPQIRELTLSSPRSVGWFKETMELEKLKIWSKCSMEDVSNIAKFGSLKSVDLRVDSVDSLNCLASLKKLETLQIAVEQE